LEGELSRIAIGAAGAQRALRDTDRTDERQFNRK
jgi:hypothetical protein